jgi:hypothetical protein
MESVAGGEHAIWIDIGKPLFARRNSIESYVIISGIEIPMKEIDSNRIIHEHQLPLCGGSVEYSLRTKNQSVFGSRTFTETSGPYTVSVPMAGSWAWWSPVNSRPSDGDFEMNLVGLEANNVIVRNYGDASLTVLSISITAPGIRGFTIIDKPELPVSLACGDSLTFEVRWNEDPRVLNDLGTLQMQFARGAPSPQSRVITLNAGPGPG